MYGVYVWEFSPGHPLQNHWGWVAQHRLVGCDIVGRTLIQNREDPRLTEDVHHIDGRRTNNSMGNLQVLTKQAHRRLHGKKTPERHANKFSTEQVREAMVGRTIREAAVFLHTTHMTIRRRFPELVAPRKRKSPCDPSDPKWLGIVRPFAADPGWTLDGTARELGISASVITAICRKYGIRWVANMKLGRTGRPKKPYIPRPATHTCTGKKRGRPLGAKNIPIPKPSAFDVPPIEFAI